jgi:hypothetical protein
LTQGSLSKKYLPDFNDERSISAGNFRKRFLLLLLLLLLLLRVRAVTMLLLPLRKRTFPVTPPADQMAAAPAQKCHLARRY